MAELALNDDQRDALARHLDHVGLTELVRSEARPDTSTHRCAAQLLSGGGLRPGAAAGRSSEDAEQRADGPLDADGQPVVELFPGPVVHADFEAAAAFAAADEHCAVAGVEVSLCERERFVDAQPGAPEHDDQPAHTQAVTPCRLVQLRNESPSGDRRDARQCLLAVARLRTVDPYVALLLVLHVERHELVVGCRS
jgi:hypothetical protein